MPKTYYIADSGAETCSVCTSKRLRSDYESGAFDHEPKVLLAALRLAHLIDRVDGSDETHFLSTVNRVVREAKCWDGRRHRRWERLSSAWSHLVDQDTYGHCRSEAPSSGVHCDGCFIELEPEYVTCVRCNRDGWYGESRNDLGAIYLVSSDQGEGGSVICDDCGNDPDEGLWTKVYTGTELSGLLAEWHDWLSRPERVYDTPELFSFGYFLAERRRTDIARSHVGELFPIAS